MNPHTTRTESPEDRRARLEALDLEGYEPPTRREWIAGALAVALVVGTALGGLLSALAEVTR